MPSATKCQATSRQAAEQRDLHATTTLSTSKLLHCPRGGAEGGLGAPYLGAEPYAHVLGWGVCVGLHSELRFYPILVLIGLQFPLSCSDTVRRLCVGQL